MKLRRQFGQKEAISGRGVIGRQLVDGILSILKDPAREYGLYQVDAEAKPSPKS
jgi:hypothetical protein